MRITLVHPAGSNWMPGMKDVTATANRMAPLGLLSIAAYLQREGHAVEIHDCLGPEAVPGTEANVRRILATNPDLVGFSTTTSGFLDGYDLAVGIKAMRPEIRIVFGGAHVSAIGAPLLRHFPKIDFLVMGEGEATLAELASGADPSQIDGLIYREGGRYGGGNGGPDGGQVTANPPRAPIPELDDLPFPAYEKLAGFPDGYNLPLFCYIQTPGATMNTSRGCPYQCSYCDRSVFQKSYRYNSAAYIYAHMRYLRDRFGVRHINIYDDLFTLHRGRISELCQLLIRKPLGMDFNCAVRVGHADDELLKMLRAAGGLQVSLGIESGDPELLETHKPGVYLDEVRDTVRRIQRTGLRAKGLFMMGLPGETVESIQKTSDFVMSLGLDDMNMSKFTPFFGAPVWDTITEQGTFNQDWRQMNCLNFVFVPEGIDSKETLDQLYNTHVKRFYSDPEWRRKFRRRMWEHRRSIAYAIRNLPDLLAAKRSFEPKEE